MLFLSSSLVAVNGQRHHIEFQNNSTGNIGYSFTSTTPVIGNTGTFVLPPGAEYSSAANFIPGNAVWIIGATTGQVVTCFQY